MINAAERVVVHQNAVAGDGDDVIDGKVDCAMMEVKRQIGAKAVRYAPTPVMVGAGQKLCFVCFFRFSRMIDRRIPRPQAVRDLVMKKDD